jgi:hypothetical protein
MELFESHFNTLSGNLYYDSTTNSYEMFSGNGKPNHLNYLTFKKLFELIPIHKEPVIVETGIASAGTNSTYLFNEYIKKYGGRFWSVDINRDLVDKHSGNMCPGTTLVHGDSVDFLRSFDKKINIAYLDSYDLDFYTPFPSGKHGLEEYRAIQSKLTNKSLLLIDDTPIEPYWLDTRGALYNDMCIFYEKNKYLPGKGMFVLNEITNAEKLLHQYQVLYQTL